MNDIQFDMDSVAWLHKITADLISFVESKQELGWGSMSIGEPGKNH